jgi:hypothetical protein
MSENRFTGIMQHIARDVPGLGEASRVIADALERHVKGELTVEAVVRAAYEEYQPGRENSDLLFYGWMVLIMGLAGGQGWPFTRGAEQ